MEQQHQQQTQNEFLTNQAQALRKIFSECSGEISNLFLQANDEGQGHYNRGRLESYKVALRHITAKGSYKFIPFQEMVAALQKDLDNTTSKDAEVAQTLKLDGLALKPNKKRGAPSSFADEDGFRSGQSADQAQSGAVHEARRMKFGDDP